MVNGQNERCNTLALVLAGVGSISARRRSRPQEGKNQHRHDSRNNPVLHDVLERPGSGKAVAHHRDEDEEREDRQRAPAHGTSRIQIASRTRRAHAAKPGGNEVPRAPQ